MNTRGIVRLTLILAVFVAQWVFFAHEYHDHDVGHPCEICVGVASLAHALPASGLDIPAPARTFSLNAAAQLAYPSLPARRRYWVRGPPTALS